ncbi:hypothetical protein N7532_002913 [Penicillium argentinense]|uniref:Uncharacterized protein n=1 Tax=Penicillium argentinense TaxID=1131581 RepID=A0A9W9G1I9_9EURO|nr:uncharacterized protein N7532_002913 [Penicillium argentinense]KAJ5110268.1 hypothetical protein N7532_002913 [Penicillium argentinense]
MPVPSKEGKAETSWRVEPTGSSTPTEVGDETFILAPWEARIPCVIEDAEAARASHDQIERELLDWECERTFDRLQDDLQHLQETQQLQEHQDIQHPQIIRQPSDANSPPTVSFFTDGGGYEGHVGASAVAPRAGIFERRHLGSMEES